MTPEEEKELTEHINAMPSASFAIGKILYRQAKPEQVETLVKIEETVRQQTLEHISPRIGIFLSSKEQKIKEKRAFGEITKPSAFILNREWRDSKKTHNWLNGLINKLLIQF